MTTLHSGESRGRYRIRVKTCKIGLKRAFYRLFFWTKNPKIIFLECIPCIALKVILQVFTRILYLPLNNQALFQTDWFVEILMTQTLIIHAIYTAKIPFFQSWASLPMLLITATVMAVGIYLPFSPIAASLGFVSLSAVYFCG